MIKIGDTVRASDHCGARNWKVRSIIGAARQHPEYDILDCSRVKADSTRIQKYFRRNEVSPIINNNPQTRS